MFSGNVHLELRTSQGVVPLASISHSEVIPKRPVELESGEADVVMDLDGVQFIWPVKMPHGSVPFDESIQTESNGEMQRFAKTV